MDEPIIIIRLESRKLCIPLNRSQSWDAARVLIRVYLRTAQHQRLFDQGRFTLIDKFGVEIAPLVWPVGLFADAELEMRFLDDDTGAAPDVFAGFPELSQPQQNPGQTRQQTLQANEQSAQQRESDARRREQDARQRELDARQREQDARQREQDARQREMDAQNRWDTSPLQTKQAIGDRDQDRLDGSTAAFADASLMGMKPLTSCEIAVLRFLACRSRLGDC